MKITVHSSINDIPVQQWNKLVKGDYPFLKHEVLSAMENCGCVGEHVGWLPRHLSYFENGELVGAMPLYEKHNSWGEFVFDHTWADAYYRAGIDYYPKLVNAIPFTPASGQRILVGEQKSSQIIAMLIKTANTLVDQQVYSGIHCLFPSSNDFDLLNQQNAVSRYDCQFHWQNVGYRDFEDFLSTLKSKKRKNIQQERMKVRKAGVNIRRLNGHTASEQDWQDFTFLYRLFYDRMCGMPAFNWEYFMEIAEKIPSQVHLILVNDGAKCLAGALLYSDQDTLYGRHWGCNRYIDSLHFEVCYYQGIEMCLENNWLKFDPGAQGEHKVARGFLPILTRSLHWMANGSLNQAIQQFIDHEQMGTQQYIDIISRHSPYRITGARG